MDTFTETHDAVSVGSSPINIKDFIKYLDKTLDLFDDKCDYTDFQNPNSDVYQMFSTLFRTYCNLADNSYTSETDKEYSRDVTKRTHPSRQKHIKKFKTYLDDRLDSNVSKIITKKLELDHIHHFENSSSRPPPKHPSKNLSKKHKRPVRRHSKPTYSVDSDMDAKHLYKKSIKHVQKDLTDSDDLGPIIYSEQVSAHKRYLKTTNNKARPSLLDELREIKNVEHTEDRHVSNKKEHREERPVTRKKESSLDSHYESKSLSEHGEPQQHIRHRSTKKPKNVHEALVKSKLKSIREEYDDFDNDTSDSKSQLNTKSIKATSTITLPAINNSIASIQADTDAIEQKINSMKKILNQNVSY